MVGAVTVAAALADCDWLRESACDWLIWSWFRANLTSSGGQKASCAAKVASMDWMASGDGRASRLVFFTSGGCINLCMKEEDAEGCRWWSPESGEVAPPPGTTDASCSEGARMSWYIQDTMLSVSDFRSKPSSKHSSTLPPARFKTCLVIHPKPEYTTRPHQLTKLYKHCNIAGRLPENSRNSFVDLQSQKNIKKDRPKKFVSSLKADLLCFD